MVSTSRFSPSTSQAASIKEAIFSALVMAYSSA
jgi:hypothetical protein